MAKREYYYVGPASIGLAARGQPTGCQILTLKDLRAWLASVEAERSKDGTCTATFTINSNGELLLAPRRSEHVACASGGPVLSAGEISFDNEMNVFEVSNQSTGFCPEPETWPVVAEALERIGIQHPGGFTNPIVFRLCPNCGERNIVKDNWYYCVLCDAGLPTLWNFGP